MPSLQTVFDACHPRADVLSGTTRDEQFVADLARVVNGTAPAEYADAPTFFRHSYATRGMKDLLKAVCSRLTGHGGEIGSIIRLHTQYGGGKTHGLIALVHAARGMKGVPNPGDFVSPDLIPTVPVRVAALDGENSDPANGLTLEGNLRAYSIWGELAYRLAGAGGYERVRESDRQHVAPGAETIRELFGGQPALILLDEISVYLRKVEQARPGSSNQFAAFVHALFKAVASSPNVALVYTIALGRDNVGQDAYKEENERAAQAMAEAEKVAARSSTQLNPTEEDETADVLRARLFDSVDAAAGDQAIAGYADLWHANHDYLPLEASLPSTRDQFRRTYPFHPETLNVLTEKLSSLSTFHRTRGMLRLLTRTVYWLWKHRPADTYAIHPHHIDPAFDRIRDEITTKLDQGAYMAALKADVAAVTGDQPALAQQLDNRLYPGRLPITSYLANTIFLHTLAYGDSAKGISPERLKFSVCSPGVEPAFVEQARIQFVADAIYLDDRPGAPMRFMAEPNLNQIIRRHASDIEDLDVRNELRLRIQHLFGLPRGPFQLSIFPPGPYDVPDEVGDGRPYLAVMSYESVTVKSDPTRPPVEVEDIFQYKNSDGRLRELRNNLLFVVAGEREIARMKDITRRRLALAELRKPEHIKNLADHQQRKVNEEFQTSLLDQAVAILQCYRHLFYPSHMAMPDTQLPVGHTAIELSSPGDRPGDGQYQIERILHDQKKLLTARDDPDAPTFVRDQTPLKTKGFITTAALRDEFRRAPKLAMLEEDTPLLICIRQGIEQEVFIYREGDRVWGRTDPTPAIRLNDNEFVYTMAEARRQALWPRSEPLEVRFTAFPGRIRPGESAELTVTVKGGTPPYTYACSEPSLSAAATDDRTLSARVLPDSSATWQVEVTDSRKQKRAETAIVLVAEPGKDAPPPKPPTRPVDPPTPPPPPTELQAEGPLLEALREIWEKARKAKHARIQKLIIRLYDALAIFKVHGAMATIGDAAVTCELEAELQFEGVKEFLVRFHGPIDKANAVKTFLEPQARCATDRRVEAVYTLEFAAGLPLAGDGPENLTKSLTRYGGGEAYVEAHAAAPESKEAPRGE